MLKFKNTIIPLRINNAELASLCKELLDNGYRVYGYASGISPVVTFIHFVNQQDQIGYADLEFEAIKFSTVNKPSSDCGTGFIIPTVCSNLNMADLVCKMNTPSWAQHCIPIKYKDWQDKVKNSQLEYNEIVLGE